MRYIKVFASQVKVGDVVKRESVTAQNGPANLIVDYCKSNDQGVTVIRFEDSEWARAIRSDVKLEIVDPTFDPNKAGSYNSPM